MVDPKEDGINHINIYSKGKTPIGRFLSNFADCNVETEDGPFRTIEGYWYWLSASELYNDKSILEQLRTTNGWESKQLGRKLRAADWVKTPWFYEKILRAIATKVQTPWCVEQLIKTGQLPFFHYYVVNGKVAMPKDGLWMVQFIQEFRDELVRGSV